MKFSLLTSNNATALEAAPKLESRGLLEVRNDGNGIERGAIYLCLPPPMDCIKASKMWDTEKEQTQTQIYTIPPDEKYVPLKFWCSILADSIFRGFRFRRCNSDFVDIAATHRVFISNCTAISRCIGVYEICLGGLSFERGFPEQIGWLFGSSDVKIADR